MFQARKLNPFCLIIRQSIKISHRGTFSRWDGAIGDVHKPRALVNKMGQMEGEATASSFLTSQTVSNHSDLIF